MIDTSQLVDERVPIEPDWFSFHELPDSLEGFRVLCVHQQALWEGSVSVMRVTYFNDEYPNEPYPHGVYFEGWTVDPAHVTPLGKQAPFNYPLQHGGERER